MIAYVPNSANVNFICDLIAKHEEVFKTSFFINYFLECLKIYYEPPFSFTTRKRIDLADLLLVKNVDLAFKEFEQCINRALRSTSTAPELRQLHYENLRDLSSLTENSNFLHRPALDSQVILKMPHANLAMLDTLDVIVGVTSHESFYFLYHDYNINDILLHAFIHASLINTTSNLLVKLSEVHQNRELNFCLKRRLFDYYGIEMTDEQLEKNSLKNNSKSLEMISDYDFVLPVVTHLRYKLAARKTGDRKNENRLFVYEYGHQASINYLTDYMASIGVDYTPHAVKYDNKISAHFSELDFVFGLPLLSRAELVHDKNNVTKYDYTADEYALSEKMIQYWSNFARSG
jgi:carboxylesterase type B